MKIIDITMSIQNKMLTYPGDPGVKIERAKRIEKDGVNLTRLMLGAHTGTHVDAPCHFIAGKTGIDRIDLKRLVGPCQVIDLSEKKSSINAEDLFKFRIRKGDRILIKTTNSKLLKKKTFHQKFIALEESAAKLLVKKKVSLVGADYLSIEPYKNPGHPTHINLLQNDIAVLEGLDLSKVSAGHYFLAALPLKIEGADGSPARVVLIEDILLK